MKLAIAAALAWTVMALQQQVASAGCIDAHWCYCRQTLAAAQVEIVDRDGDEATAKVIAVSGDAAAAGVAVGDQIAVDASLLFAVTDAVVLFAPPSAPSNPDAQTGDTAPARPLPTALPIAGTVLCVEQPSFGLPPAEVLRISVLEYGACRAVMDQAGFTEPPCNDTQGERPGCGTTAGPGGLLAAALALALVRRRLRRPEGPAGDSGAR